MHLWYSLSKDGYFAGQILVPCVAAEMLSLRSQDLNAGGILPARRDTAFLTSCIQLRQVPVVCKQSRMWSPLHLTKHVHSLAQRAHPFRLLHNAATTLMSSSLPALQLAQIGSDELENTDLLPWPDPPLQPFP